VPPMTDTPQLHGLLVARSPRNTTGERSSKSEGDEAAYVRVGYFWTVDKDFVSAMSEKPLRRVMLL